jgi:hypothetical protein
MSIRLLEHHRLPDLGPLDLLKLCIPAILLPQQEKVQLQGRIDI